MTSRFWLLLSSSRCTRRRCRMIHDVISLSPCHVVSEVSLFLQRLTPPTNTLTAIVGSSFSTCTVSLSPDVHCLSSPTMSLNHHGSLYRTTPIIVVVVVRHVAVNEEHCQQSSSIQLEPPRTQSTDHTHAHSSSSVHHSPELGSRRGNKRRGAGKSCCEECYLHLRIDFLVKKWYRRERREGFGGGGKK